jgi:hypothetical protein
MTPAGKHSITWLPVAQPPPQGAGGGVGEATLASSGQGTPRHESHESPAQYIHGHVDGLIVSAVGDRTGSA